MSEIPTTGHLHKLLSHGQKNDDQMLKLLDSDGNALIEHISKADFNSWTQKLLVLHYLHNMITPRKIEDKQVEKRMMYYSNYKHTVLISGFLQIKVPLLHLNTKNNREYYFVLDREIGLTWYEKCYSTHRDVDEM